jgi:hypothetical protein
MSQPARPLQGAVAIDFVGDRFAVGRTDRAYAIWDVAVGGAPLSTYPLTEAGWSDAWAAFRGYEPGDVRPPEIRARSMDPGVVPIRRPLTFPDVLAAGFRLYVRHAPAMIALAAVVIIPFALLQAVVFDALFGPVVAELRPGDPVSPELAGRLVRELLPAIGLSVVVSFLVNGFLTAAVTRAGLDAAVGREVRFASAARGALRQLHSILWVLLLTGLVVLAFMLVPFGVLVVAVGSRSAGLAFLAVLLLIGLALYGYVRVVFALPAVVAEGRRGTDAVVRAWRLSTGLAWKIAGVLLLIGLMIGLAQAVIGEIVNVASGPAQPSAFDTLTYIGILSTALGSSVLTPLILLMVVVLYADARLRKDGSVLDA